MYANESTVTDDDDDDALWRIKRKKKSTKERKTAKDDYLNISVFFPRLLLTMIC